MADKCRVFRALLRTRRFAPEELETTPLKICLSFWDLTALGVGSTLGVGLYVLVGAVALSMSGPSVVLSFLFAAVAALFAGLCYAELGSRVPRAGSAYIYTYTAIGELAAFVIGWLMILEAMLGTASIARGLSMLVDNLTGNSMSPWFVSFAPLDAAYLSTYFDFFAFVIVLVIGGLLASGVRQSTATNNIFVMVHLVVVAFMIVAGGIKAKSSNWSIPEEDVPPGHGNGGFFPFGIMGTLKGTAVCFYGFVGFDVISSTGEEVREPRRSIPLSIISMLLIVLVLYASVSAVVTMMVPYYLQDRVASVASAFTYVDMEWAWWLVSIGALFGIMASLFGALFPLPRLLYAMASDGLLVHWFASVNEKRKSPVIATVFSTCVVAILAGLMELDELLKTVCIGTLLSYTVVALCVISLRYSSDWDVAASTSFFKQFIGCGDRVPTKSTSRIIKITLVLFISLCVCMALVAVHVERPIISLTALHAVALCLLVIMCLQPKNKEEVAFKTPVVPLIPCLSIYVNIHLMILLSYITWLRVLVWILIGLLVYLLCKLVYKPNKKGKLEENLKAHANKNGKTPVQIVIESPTPPDTMTRISTGGDTEIKAETMNTEIRRSIDIKDEIIQEAAIENAEKEAKIIDLLDQVLQAEEDSYGEIINLKEIKETPNEEATIPHRKSLSELSDAGSDASLGIQVLSKYDVIAQVHREDMPRVNEEEEKSDKEQDENTDDNNNEAFEHEQVTAFNDSDSRTDESGYSDTFDRNVLIDSTEDTTAPHIPTPPPLDENWFNSPNFKKSYTIAARPTRKIETEESEEENKPRDSVQSATSTDDGTIVFGSDRQMNFMSKLNDLFQNKIQPNEEGEEKRRRSNSTGDVVEAEAVINRERPALFQELQKEILSMQSALNLRPVNVEDEKPDSDEEDNSSMSREDLKSKLENIFAAGGPKLLRPRIMKSNPPTPEESYQTDTSSSESIAKLPKVEKNDTLKRQKDKFGEVLKSFRVSLNQDDKV